jgi:hypothetical protein
MENQNIHETKFQTLEKKATDALEVAEKKASKKEASQKAAQIAKDLNIAFESDETSSKMGIFRHANYNH